MFHLGTYYNYFVFTLLYLGKALNYDSYRHRHVITLWCLQIVDVGLNFVVYKSLKEWLIRTKPFGLIEDSKLSVTRLACDVAEGTVGQTDAYPLDVI